MSHANSGFYVLAEPQADSMRFGPIQVQALSLPLVEVGEANGFILGEHSEFHIIAVSPIVPNGRGAILTIIAQERLRPNGDGDEEGGES